MTESERKVRGVGFGNIFAGKDIALRTAPVGNRNDDESQESSRKVVADKSDSDSGGSERARCTFDYKAEFEDELPLAIGDIVIILDKNLEDDGWWKGKLVSSGRIGVFPNNFVEMIVSNGASKGVARLASDGAPQSKQSEAASLRLFDTNVLSQTQQKKVPEIAPPLPAKPGGRIPAPPVGAKPKSPAKLPESASLPQSVSMHSVSTSFESGAVAKQNSTLHLESDARPNASEQPQAPPTSIRERLERLNLASTAPPGANSGASAPPASLPPRGLRKSIEERPSVKKPDEKVRSGSVKKRPEETTLEVESGYVDASSPSEEPTTLKSLTKGRPRVPRAARSQPNNAGSVPSQATDLFDYTVSSMPVTNANTGTSANSNVGAKTLAKAPTIDSMRPPVDGDLKVSAHLAIESASSMTYQPSVAKLDGARELVPPQRPETQHSASTTHASVPRLPQRHEESNLTVSMSMSATSSIKRPADETKRLDEAVASLREELAALRDENARLDRRVTVLERELNDERRARHALALEIDALKKH